MPVKFENGTLTSATLAEVKDLAKERDERASAASTLPNTDGAVVLTITKGKFDDCVAIQPFVRIADDGTKTEHKKPVLKLNEKVGIDFSLFRTNAKTNFLGQRVVAVGKFAETSTLTDIINALEKASKDADVVVKVVCTEMSVGVGQRIRYVKALTF